MQFKITLLKGKTMQMTGAKMIMEIFRKEGVETVFGYPGGAIMNVYDEIYKHDHFEHVLTRHEQAAIHAADGYARSTGRVGVAIVTSGPGFTNAVTGLATAYTDSTPLVVLSGQVMSHLLGTDGFQEIDAVGISRPCTKHNFLIKDVRDLPRIFKEAFYIAQTGRPGPVLIDLPKDISVHVDEFIYPETVNLPTYNPYPEPMLGDIDEVVKAIKKSKKPILYLGGGIVRSSAQEEVRELADFSQIPLFETIMARGVIEHSKDLHLGMIGMHGTYAANMGLYESDLIICVGARFDDRVTGNVNDFGKFAKIIHIDIDPSSIGKIIAVDYSILGDIKAVLKILNPQIKEAINPKRYESWGNHLKTYKKENPLVYKDSEEGETLKPQWVIQETGSIIGDEGIITVDVGQHQMWTSQYYPFSDSRQLISSSGLGTMGFGLPASMGVSRGRSDKLSVCITGDGGVLMNIQELTTCAQYKIPLIVIIVNNSALGMVRQWQTFFYDNRFSHVDLSHQPDFVKVAEAFGCVGYRAKTKEEFQSALKDAKSKKQTSIIDVVVTKLEEVLPMMPAGAALNNMILLDQKNKTDLIHTVKHDEDLEDEI